MGIDYTAKLIVGIPGDILFEAKTTTKTKKVKKFNPDNGEPYEKEIKTSNTKYYWLGKEVEDNDEHELAESIGLEYILGSYPTGEDPVYGKELGELDRGDNESYIEFDLTEIKEAMEEVRLKLFAVGIEAPVKVYMMNQCS